MPTAPRWILALFTLALGLSFAAEVRAQEPPSSWTRCSAETFYDGVCDCGCGAPDADCPSGTFELCERSGCPTGQVPWEHSPGSCMQSACGDGWMDDAMGEACDDGDALAGGGCNATCSEVTAGFSCGVRAQGCTAAAPDAGVVDGGAPDGGAVVDTGVTPDAGEAPDAGETVDAGETPDTGVTVDAGTTAAVPEETEEGSGCNAAGATMLSPWLLAGLLVLTRRRSRR